MPNVKRDIIFEYRGLKFHDLEWDAPSEAEDCSTFVEIHSEDNGVQSTWRAYQGYGRVYTRDQACERALAFLNDSLRRYVKTELKFDGPI